MAGALSLQYNKMQLYSFEYVIDPATGAVTLARYVTKVETSIGPQYHTYTGTPAVLDGNPAAAIADAYAAHQAQLTAAGYAVAANPPAPEFNL